MRSFHLVTGEFKNNLTTLILDTFLFKHSKFLNDDYMNFIYWNREIKKYMQRRSSQLKTQLIQLRKESLKKFRLAGSRTQTSAIPLQRSKFCTLLHEIFAKCLFRDFDVYIFRDT